ncbi:MAG: type VI secretion system lipoprotein TssJ [Gammaproteobacteria bacterium]|jgi:type VI secretion system protein VasD|nr:type VI secretion system lipoprotein TssJ [Gammaproteobacteria bacterium]
MIDFTPPRCTVLRKLHNVALIGVVAVALLSCGGKPAKAPIQPMPEAPPQLSVDVATTDDANAGGLPIVIRIYELNAQGKFSSADFFSLYDDDAATLADSLVSREELTLAPGQSRAIRKELSPETAYLGVLGAFRDVDNAQWRSVLPLQADADNGVAVTVGTNAIRVETL